MAIHQQATGSKPGVSALAPEGPASKRPRSTTHGPSRRTLVLAFGEATEIPVIDLVELTGRCNVLLRADNFVYCVAHTRVQNRMYILSGSSVPTPNAIKALETLIAKRFLTEYKGVWSLTPPSSKSYLRVVDVPRYKGFGENKALTRPEDVEAGLRAAGFTTSDLPLAGPPRLDPVSDKADISTAYFDIWDSQSGARGKALHGRTFHFLGSVVRIAPSNASPGTPLCTRCWRWGHAAGRCKSQGHHCKKCGEPHDFNHHREVAGCCKGAPKATPPILPTPVGTPCPHKDRCLNCGGDHIVDSRKCWFWGKRFNRDAIMSKYQSVHESKRAAPSSAI